MKTENQCSNQRPTRVRFMSIAILIAATTLSACGDGQSLNDGDIASVAKAASAPSGTLDAANQTSPATSFIDNIFNTQAGDGYYIFGWNSIQSVSTGGTQGDTGMTRTRLGVIDGSDTTLRQSYTQLTGSDALQFSKIVYIKDEGAFSADTLPYDDLGPRTKIFQRLPDGFDFGVQGMTTPLYRVTLDVQDVSGQTVTSVADHFQGGHEETVQWTPPPGIANLIGPPKVVGVVNPLTVNMPRLVFPASDTTLMPAGSKMYTPTYTAQTTFLRVDLSNNPSNYTFDQYINTFKSMPALSLGGYRYTKAMGTGEASSFRTSDRYLVEYGGKLYPAVLVTAGDHLSMPVTDISLTRDYSIVAPSPAYNKVAAAFLTRQLGSTPQQTHNVNVHRPNCTPLTLSCDW